MKVILIYPPLTDPTCGYLSLPYLASYVRSVRDDEVQIIDANVEALEYLAQPQYVRDLRHEAADYISRIDRSDWTGESQSRYHDALAALTLDEHAPQAAIEVLRSATEFFDYQKYHVAATSLMRWLRALSLRGMPRQFENFTLNARALPLCNLEQLTSDSILTRISRPFQPYVNDRLIPLLAAEHPEVVGMGVSYHEQLPFALAFAPISAERCLELESSWAAPTSARYGSSPRRPARCGISFVLQMPASLARANRLLLNFWIVIVQERIHRASEAC